MRRKSIKKFILSMGLFIIFWLFMFFYQFRSPNNYDGRIDMKEYAFCSNITVEFPTWIVRVLFLNARLVKLPVVIVVGQICNYIFMIVYFLWELLGDCIEYSCAMNYITVWFAFLITILLVMCVNFEIFYHKNK